MADDILKKYFKKDEAGYYYNAKCNGYRLKGVSHPKDRTRNDKAVGQAEIESVSFSKVYAYINEFLELIRESNGFTDKIIQADSIQLDNKEHIIIDNGIIIIRENKWDLPKGHWEGNYYTYDSYDKKYDAIKTRFQLERVSDILWFKFTDKGHLAVVASSCDINWEENTSCGILVNEVEESFDTSFVFIFPLTQQMIRTKAEPNSYYRKYSVAELELAVGNFLIDKGVPIIDYFSHMGYKYE